LFAEVERLAKVGSWIWDLGTNEVYWSPELYRILGYDPALTPTAERFFEAIHPDDRDAVRERSAETSRTGNTEPGVRCRVALKDGTVRHIIVIGSGVLDSEGRLFRLVGAVLDVTEFVTTETELRQTAALLNEAQRIARLGSWIWHRDTDRVEWSDTMFSIVGIEPEATGGTRRLLEHIHPDDRPRLEAMRGALARGEPTSTLELRFLHADGSVRHISVNARSGPQPEGRVVGTVLDVTQRHALEQQLFHSQKMEALGALAGGIAHDFNNYLVVIRGNLDLLRDGLTSDGEREMLDEVTRASERCAGLTRQLLTFGRKHQAALSVLDLGRLVEESGSMLRRLLGARVDLGVRVEPGSQPVLGDPSQLELVIVNLAVNARDAMPDGGRLTLSVAPREIGPGHHPVLKPGEYTTLTVSDTGVGIPDELKTRVFEPFFTTKQVGQGTGLGLATVYAIVRQSFGHIEVESHRDVGTAFTIWLPVQRGATNLLESTPESRLVARGEVILLVEDEPGVRRLTRRLLERGGYRVLEADNGLTALGVVESSPELDLVLTDITMPQLDGIALVRHLREKHPKLRLMMMSGYPDAATQASLGQALDTMILAKPFTLERLLEAVRKVLDETR
jgi:PAS domain S-box-containing protein